MVSAMEDSENQTLQITWNSIEKDSTSLSYPRRNIREEDKEM